MDINERIRERMDQFIAEEAARWQLDNMAQEYMAMSALSGSTSNASSIYWETSRSEPARLYYRRNGDEEWQQADHVDGFSWTSGNSFSWDGPFDPVNDIRRTEPRGIQHTPEFTNRWTSAVATWQGQWELTYLGPDNEEALAKSKKLLMSFLDSEQLAEFESHTRITVKTVKNVYRIFAQKQFNVQQRQPDGKWVRLCAIPNKSLPIYDTMLAQMLVLQTNEDAFLKVANTEPTMLNWEAFACSYGR